MSKSERHRIAAAFALTAILFLFLAAVGATALAILEDFNVR